MLHVDIPTLVNIALKCILCNCRVSCEKLEIMRLLGLKLCPSYTYMIHIHARARVLVDVCGSQRQVPTEAKRSWACKRAPRPLGLGQASGHEATSKSRPAISNLISRISPRNQPKSTREGHRLLQKMPRIRWRNLQIW